MPVGELTSRSLMRALSAVPRPRVQIFIADNGLVVVQSTAGRLRPSAADRAHVKTTRWDGTIVKTWKPMAHMQRHGGGGWGWLWWVSTPPPSTLSG